MITSLNVSVDTGSKGSNGSVYLNLGGREFLLDTSNNDFQANSSNSFVFGENTNVKSSNLQDPRSGFPLSFDDLNLFPTYVRSVSDNPWSVKGVNVIVKEQDGRFAFFRRQSANNQEIKLGSISGRSLYLLRLQELTTAFAGTATLALPQFNLSPGPFFQDFSATLVFIQNDTFVTCILNPMNINTDAGELTVTQSGTAMGSFNQSSGAMTLSLPLTFELENPVFGNPKGSATFPLTSGTSGPLTGAVRDAATGAIRLVAQTTVEKGSFLIRGQTVQMTLDGLFSPIV